jgi:large subunit ribosomal protein L6
MSRIGKSPVLVPANVKVFLEGRRFRAEGPLGKLGMELPPKVTAKLEAGVVHIVRDSDERIARSMHGLARELATFP